MKKIELVSVGRLHERHTELSATQAERLEIINKIEIHTCGSIYSKPKRNRCKYQPLPEKFQKQQTFAEKVAEAIKEGKTKFCFTIFGVIKTEHLLDVRANISRWETLTNYHFE